MIGIFNFSSYLVFFFSLNYFAENPDDRYNLYMQYSEAYPRAQAPKRIPLSFTTGKFLSNYGENFKC